MVNVFLRRLGLPLVLLAALGGCTSKAQLEAQREEAQRRERVAMLGEYLTGSFSSEAQSKADAEYFDIRLHIVPIWPARSDGPWLYVEQARADVLEQPYRQRVYRLSARADGTLASDVYEMPEPLRFAGAFKDVSRLEGLSPEQLQLKEGCAVVLRPDPATLVFAGGTVGNGCGSTLRGAAYATSEVTLSRETLLSWDRGFNAAGEQVWGAKKGGYVFVKQPAATTGAR